MWPLSQISTPCTFPRCRQMLRECCLLGVAFAGISGCWGEASVSQQETPAVNSHQQMLATLEEIRLDSQENHPFLGMRPLREAEQALRSRAATAKPSELSTLHGVYGQELLRMGKTAEAIVELQSAVELLEAQGAFASIPVREKALYLLAVAYLRAGENANCVNCLNGERCLFPIQGEGVHEQPAASRQAVDYFQRALALTPNDESARWLLNIAAMTLGEYPAKVPQEFLIGPEHFTSLPSPVGEFKNVASALGLDAQSCAGGVIADDFDGDGDFDVISSSWSTDGQLQYFRNNGDGTFADQTTAANLTGIFGGLNLLQADYDNDGDLDVLVLRGAWLEMRGRHPNSLLQNDGTGRFMDVTYDVGLAENNSPTQTASWADFDLDGDLDLYIGNEGVPSQLFENIEGRSFREIAHQAGVTNNANAKGVIWGDYDADGWPDLYVSNLPGQNRLYHNNGNKTFTDVASDLGVAGPLYSFPVWFWDYDNDGILDLYVSSYQPGIRNVARDYQGAQIDEEPDRFYRGLPGGGFEDQSHALGFTRVTQPMGANFGDIDNDGFLDIYLGTGYVDYEGLMPNLLFHNRRGTAFDDITFSARVGHLQKGHGVAFADLDQDGDQDILAEMGGWFAGDKFANAVFENPGSNHNWLSVRLKGVETNRFGVGCRVRATFKVGEDTRTIYRWMNSGGSFGANPLRIHLGLESAERIDELEVYWPVSRTTQSFQNLPVNQLVEITEATVEYYTKPLTPMSFPQGKPTASTP